MIGALVSGDGKAAAAFECILLTCEVERFLDLAEVFAVRCREEFRVKEVHRFAAGVVIATDEPGVGWDMDSTGLQLCANLWAICDQRKKAGIWCAGPSSASPAAVCGLVGVVQAGGAVSEHDHQARVVFVKSCRPEYCTHAVGLLLRGKSREQAGGGVVGFLILPHECQFRFWVGKEKTVECRG